MSVRSQSDSAFATYSVGEKVTVLYQPGKADQARIENFFGQYSSAIISGLFGIIFGFVSGLILFMSAQARRWRRLALATGKPVKAKVIEVRIDPSFRVNGRNPWVIVAEYQEENQGRKFVFTSEFLWINPESYYPVGSEVTVFYLPENPSTYALVLDKIPETP